MASGEFAEQIYELIEEMSGRNADVGNSHEYVLSELIAYLPAGSIRGFTKHFRQNNNMIKHELEEDETDSFELVPNSYHLCLDCQNSYDIDKPHICDAQADTEDQPKSKYFSSLIPEC